MKPAEIREMDHEAREVLLNDLMRELMHERGVSAMGGAPPNPGRLRTLRRDIARVKTILRQEKELA